MYLSLNSFFIHVLSLVSFVRFGFLSKLSNPGSYVLNFNLFCSLA